MSPRIIIFIIAGIVIYLSLSLYHGKQVKKFSEHNPGKGISTTSAKAQEKNWVQVSTSTDRNAKTQDPPDRLEQQIFIEQGGQQPELARPQPDEPDQAAGPPDSQTATVRQQLHSATEEIARLHHALQQKEATANDLAREKENLLFRVTALQNDLQEARNELHAKEKDLQQGAAEQSQLKKSNVQLNRDLDSTLVHKEQLDQLKKSLITKTEALSKANERIDSLANRLRHASEQIAEAEKNIRTLTSTLGEEENAKQQAVRTASRLRAEIAAAETENERCLAEMGRLQAQLQATNSRLVVAESTVDKAKLKAEAMLRYGQEQAKLVTPFRQEIELLNARLEDARGSLIQAEQGTADLRETELQLQGRINSLLADLKKQEKVADELQKATSALTESQTRNEQLSLMLKEMGDQVNAKESLIASLNQNVAQSQAATLEAEQQSTVLKNQLSAINDQQTALALQLEEAGTARDNLHRELQEAQQKNVELTAKLAEQQEYIQAGQTESAALRSELKTTAEQLQANAVRLQEAETALGNLQQAAQTTAERDTLLAEVQLANRQLTEQLAGSEKRLAEAQAEIAKLEQAAGDSENTTEKDQQLADLRHKLTELHTQLNTDRTQLDQAARTVTKLEDEKRQLALQLGQAEKQLKEQDSLREELRAKNTRLEQTDARLQWLGDEAASLKAELDLRESAFFSMQEEYTSLQARHEKLETEHRQLLLRTMDSDGDSVPDVDDQCPDTAGGTEVDARGCERDSDMDGIVNRLDLCPDSPEPGNINSLGCSPDRRIILPDINFASGTAELSPQAKTSLDRVADILQRSPDLLFEVGGHTDNIGDADRNLTVSQLRAQATADYLAGRGIDRSRFTAKGYGSGQPVADNNTADGRAANRRVELTIIAPGTETVSSPPANPDSEPGLTAPAEPGD